MPLDLKQLKPTVVSKDLKGKFVFIYGAPKIGKTTLAVNFPRNLLLGVEHGYNAIDNIMAVDVPNWKTFKEYVKQLERDEDLKEQYDTITIDTIGLLYERCTKYICDREDVDKVGDIPFGAGYGMIDREFETEVRKITQVMTKDGRTAYGLCLIGHEKVRIDTDGQTSYKYISPDVPERCAKIINRMVDITAYIGMENGARYIYPRQFSIEEGKQVTEIYAGSHFANLNSKIELGYEQLVDAIAEAMQTDNKGSKRKLSDAPVSVQVEEKVDYRKLITNIKKVVVKLSNADQELDDGESPHMDAYRAITERYLGKGKLVKECNESQADMLDLIYNDLVDYMKDNNIT